MVDAGQLVKLSGASAMHGLGISQVMPSTSTDTLPVTREFRRLFHSMQAPDIRSPTPASREFIGAGCSSEAFPPRRPQPESAEKVLRALERSLNYDVGGFTVSFLPATRSVRLMSKSPSVATAPAALIIFTVLRRPHFTLACAKLTPLNAHPACHSTEHAGTA